MKKANSGQVISCVVAGFIVVATVFSIVNLKAVWWFRWDRNANRVPHLLLVDVAERAAVERKCAVTIFAYTESNPLTP